MKIYLYDKWIDCPDGKDRSFKTAGSPKKIWDVDRYHYDTINRKVGNWRADISRKWLCFIKGSGYENALVGNKNQVTKFIKDCLKDLKDEL